MERIDLPFKAEYAKSNRSLCKICKSYIFKETLRLAVMVQSSFHDGKQAHWFHENCFFRKQRPGSSGDIENFESLRYEDQERLKKLIESVRVVASSSGAGKKRTKEENAALKDFRIEYTKACRNSCKGCGQKIFKGQVRVRKTVYNTKIGIKRDGEPLWHHLECFAQLREELGWLASGDELPGIKSLSKDDQKKVMDALSVKTSEDVSDAKKPKLEEKSAKEIIEEKKLEEKVKSQTKRFFQFRDNIKDQMTKPHIKELLKVNKQEPFTGDSEKLYNQLADMLTFGAIEKCSVCNGYQMLFEKTGYLCNGNLTEWTKCKTVEKEPKRKPVEVTNELKSRYPFLKDVKKKVEVRAIQYVEPSSTVVAKNCDAADGPKVKRELPPLYLFEFAQIGLKNTKDLKDRLNKLGGKLNTVIHDQTVAIFSNPEEVERMNLDMVKAKNLGIHVVPVDYLQCVEDDPTEALLHIEGTSICDWGTDPADRIPKEKDEEEVKNGQLVLDHSSGLDEGGLVYENGKDRYSVLLGLTDIQQNKNSFYKLQLLKSTMIRGYFIFRHWGRIGTGIGDQRCDPCYTLEEAISRFESLYYEKTGNKFCDRDNFVKIAGKMYPIDVDFREEQSKVDLDSEHSVESKLEKPVQDLIKLIFDVNTMKKTMKNFDLDMKKLPLAKLSQKHIQSAYNILTEIQNLIENKGRYSEFIDATNRFYTLIPHDFGEKSPPLLNTMAQVDQLSIVLDSLMEIECAYSFVKSQEGSSDVNPIDKYYEKLKAAIEPLDKNSEEFAILKKYVDNTFDKEYYRDIYELEINDVFKVVREGEASRFEPFKKLNNHRLLWHGSRITNFAGILSKGLRIAPPEAPKSGYMFGKGIYFADVVSKSANFCCTNKHNPTGLMLLSQVALGDMLECSSMRYVKKLPKGKHSTWGKGRTMPNPVESYIKEDGVEIPLGKLITNDELRSSLWHNEFIVYDVGQVNIQYLLRMHFNYKE